MWRTTHAGCRIHAQQKTLTSGATIGITGLFRSQGGHIARVTPPEVSAIPGEPARQINAESDPEAATAEGKLEAQKEELSVQFAVAQSRIDAFVEITSAPQQGPMVSVQTKRLRAQTSRLLKEASKSAQQPTSW